MALKCSTPSSSKKQKRPAPESLEFDPDIFKTAAVYDHHIRVLINKQVIQKRGFILEDYSRPL